VQYLPIESVNTDRDVLRCLPESLEQKQQILSHQGAFGLGAYEQRRFVGSLWFYRIEDLSQASPHAPPWSAWHRGAGEYNAISRRMQVGSLPTLGLSCFHVGRTKESESTDQNDRLYFGRGIGTGLLTAALAWAQSRDYRSVLSVSGIDSFPEFNIWAGTLPLKVYLRCGFGVLQHMDPDKSIPGHLRSHLGESGSKHCVQAFVIRRITPEGT
jgi:hypothetical protein